jgi:CheY-like chemotaxis protein
MPDKSARRGRILIVEDEALLRMLIADELTDRGYLVQEAASGAEAVAVLEKDRAFELVFTDIRLQGGMSGWEVADEARRLVPGIQVVYTTGYSPSASSRVEGSRMLLKPCGPSAVVQMFEALGVRPRSSSAGAPMTG